MTRPDQRHVGLREPPRAQQLEAGQGRPSRVHGILPPDEARLDLVLRPLDLLRGDRLRLHQLDLGEKGLLDHLGGLAGQRGRVEPEQVRIEGEVRVVPARSEREAALIGQLPVEARCPSLGQDRRQQIERRRVRGAEIRHVPGDVHDRDLGARLLHDQPSLVDLGRLDGGHRRRLRSPRDASEQAADAPEDLRRRDVPHHDQDGVVGSIVRVVERAQLRRSDPPDVLHPPDDGPPVRVRLERQRHHLFRHEPVRIVLGARAPLLHDDLPLGIDLLGIEEEVSHAVRLERQRQVHLVGGDIDVVRGHVLARERIVLAAVLLDEAGELSLAVGRRALEHHVLEEVGQPGRAGPLVARPDAVPDLDGDDRAPVVLQHEHPQAIVQGGLGHARAGGQRLCGRRRHGGDGQEGGGKLGRTHPPIILWAAQGSNPPPGMALSPCSAL